MKKWVPKSIIGICLLMGACSSKGNTYHWKTLEVTVKAYNSVPSQTDGSPSVAAWGDTLRPGMKCIAISRDLMPLGIGHNTPVKIQGLFGTYLVKDKMNRRWTKRIDLYLGNDIAKAKKWGKKKRTIQYRVLKKEAVAK